MNGLELVVRLMTVAQTLETERVRQLKLSDAVNTNWLDVLHNLNLRGKLWAVQSNTCAQDLRLVVPSLPRTVLTSWRRTLLSKWLMCDPMQIQHSTSVSNNQTLYMIFMWLDRCLKRSFFHQASKLSLSQATTKLRSDNETFQGPPNREQTLFV